MRTFALPIAALAACLHAAPARAQAPPPGAPIEITLGVAWSGAIQLSGPDALEADRNGNPYRLFEARSALRPGAGIIARVSVPLGHRFAAEAGFGYSTPQLRLRVSSDVENAESAVLSETLTQLQTEGGLVVYLRRARPARRSAPFVALGAGYFRELHEGHTLAADGRSYFAGAGWKQRLRARSGSWLKTAGVRLDARLVARTGGAANEDRARFAAALGAALFLGF